MKSLKMRKYFNNCCNIKIVLIPQHNAKRLLRHNYYVMLFGFVCKYRCNVSAQIVLFTTARLLLNWVYLLKHMDRLFRLNSVFFLNGRCGPCYDEQNKNVTIILLVLFYCKPFNINRQVNLHGIIGILQSYTQLKINDLKNNFNLSTNKLTKCKLSIQYYIFQIRMI